MSETITKPVSVPIRAALLTAGAYRGGPTSGLPTTRNPGDHIRALRVSRQLDASPDRILIAKERGVLGDWEVGPRRNGDLLRTKRKLIRKAGPLA